MRIYSENKPLPTAHGQNLNRTKCNISVEKYHGRCKFSPRLADAQMGYKYSKFGWFKYFQNCNIYCSNFPDPRAILNSTKTTLDI